MISRHALGEKMFVVLILKEGVFFFGRKINHELNTNFVHFSWTEGWSSVYFHGLFLSNEVNSNKFFFSTLETHTHTLTYTPR